ncbi:germ cell nuclear acidic-1 protein-like [Euwallacea fornicatus]|uniref:germ cell nuclear acidic-1 protein-like n=1 Tax=Euwallacea fornicatus TaxID=995702 RepID=UPI00338DD6D6
MEESFELLSTMSPKLKCRQKTLKLDKTSTLALRKHFRKSLLLDKPKTTRNENLHIVDLECDSFESVSSNEFGKENDDNIIVESSDSESEVDKCRKMKTHDKQIGMKTDQIHQWLGDAHGQKGTTFYSDVSTIVNDDLSIKRDKDDKQVAVSSSYYDHLVLRFDECFGKNIINEKESQERDKFLGDSFNVKIRKSLTTKFKKGVSSNRETSQLSLSTNGSKNNDVIVIDDSLVLKEENFNTASDTPPVRSPLKGIPSFMAQSNMNEHQSNGTKTPTHQNIREVKSMLDSIYGNSWRKKQDSVLQSYSEKKRVKENKTLTHTVTTEQKPLKMKEPLLQTKNPSSKKLNFNALKKPSVESPWIQKLKGLVDSDTDSDDSDQNRERGIKLVKTKLDFIDDEPIIGKSNTNIRRDKGNVLVNPQKFKKEKESSSGEDVSSDEEYDNNIKLLEITRKSIIPEKNKSYSFLESLSASIPIYKCDMSARIYRNNFAQHKHDLALRLFTLYNEKVFGNAIPKDTEIEWNVKLRKTAGRCSCVKITRRTGKIERKVKISLSTKVLDLPCRLRDTLIHEMCHAATWIVNQVADGHGKFWKSWAFKAMKVFPELPPIKRCHSFQISTKYTYKCTGCGYSFGRHSKSLDLERKRCGICYGKFEVLLNKTMKNGETKTVAATPKKQATGFALFVKENYALHKDPSKKHGEIMKALGEKFSELKVKKSN